MSSLAIKPHFAESAVRLFGYRESAGGFGVGHNNAGVTGINNHWTSAAGKWTAVGARQFNGDSNRRIDNFVRFGVGIGRRRVDCGLICGLRRLGVIWRA